MFIGTAPCTDKNKYVFVIDVIRMNIFMKKLIDICKEVRRKILDLNYSICFTNFYPLGFLVLEGFLMVSTFLPFNTVKLPNY